MFALTDLSVWLFACSPNRDILSGVCNISHSPLTRHWNNNFKCLAFAAKRVQAAATVRAFGRMAWIDDTFDVLKEPSQSNGSSEALGWPHAKGLDWCVNLCPVDSIPAALEDTAVAVLQTWPWQSVKLQNPRCHPLNRACKRALPRGRVLPSEEEIRDVEKLCMLSKPFCS